MAKTYDFAEPPLHAVIRQLRKSDQLAITRHFLRLDEATLNMRFGGSVSQIFVRQYADRVLKMDAVVFGAFFDQDLHGLAELRRLPTSIPATAEAAFSVEREWQNRGVGKSLVKRTIAAAQNRGIKALHMMCLPENERMQHIAAKQSAVLNFDPAQTEATLQTPWPTPRSIAEEFMGETKGFVNAMLHW